MRIYLYNLLFLLFGQGLCYGTVPISESKKITLSGKVTDEKGIPISGALISVNGTNIGSYSDEAGMYLLNLKPEKTYKITVSFLGFRKVEEELFLTKSSIRNVQMQEDAIVLDAVAIKGKSKSRLIREDLFAVNALSIKNQVSTVNTLNSVIGKSSGIRIRETGGVGGSFDLSINGLSGNSVRYFIDGVPMNTMGTGLSLSNLPVNIVDRVEIYKGVVPTYLGADALGGAVNIVTKNNTKNYMDVSYGIGSFHTNKLDLNAQYIPNKKIIIRPTLSYIYSKNDYKMRGVEVWDKASGSFIKTDRKRFHSAYSSFLGQLDLGIKDRKWCDYFFLSASYSKIDKDIQNGSTQKIVFGKAKRKNKALKFSARYKKDNFIIPKLNTLWLFSHTNSHVTVIDTAYRKYNWDGGYINSSRNEISGRGKSIRNIKRPLTIGRFFFDYKITPQHSVNLNYLGSYLTNTRYDDFDADFEKSKDVFSKNICGVSYKQQFFQNKLINTFFIKDYLSFLKVEQFDLYWITGSKDKAGSTTTNEIGYGAGSRYKVSDALFLKTSFEHSMRLPLAREILGNGTTVYPNFKLSPEIGDNLNFGILGTLNLHSHHKLDYETGFFLRKTSDYIMLVISETEGLSQYDNVSNVTIKGIEGEIVYTYKDLFRVKGNFSYLDERSKTKFQLNGKPEITYNNRMPNRPWLYANLGVELKKENLWGKDCQLKIMYDFRYVHWFYLTWEGYGSLKSKSTIPTQCVSDVTLSYGFNRGKYNFSLECSNIFNRTVYDNYMLQKPGRHFFCKFRLFIN